MSPLSRYKNSSYGGYLQIILKLVCAFKPSKPRHLCLNAGPITDTGILLVSGAEPLTSLKATETLSSSRNPLHCRGQLRAGLQSGCHCHSPKPTASMRRSCGIQSHAQIPSFRCLYIDILYLRLATPQPNRYACVSNHILRGMLVSSPSSHTGMINFGRYL